MVKQRYISTSFWSDPWVSDLKPFEKLLYLYLLTNELTSIAGVYKMTVRRMAYDTGIKTPDVEKTLAYFGKVGKAHLIGEYIVIPSWPDHQKWQNKATIRAGITNELRGVPDGLLSQLPGLGYRFPLEDILSIPPDTVLVPYPYEPSYSDSDSDSDLRKEKEKRRFRPPTLEEVKDYAEERGYPGWGKAEKFIDFYTSKGWKVGKVSMRDWKAAVRNWLSDEPKPAGVGASLERARKRQEEREKILETYDPKAIEAVRKAIS